MEPRPRRVLSCWHIPEGGDNNTHTFHLFGEHVLWHLIMQARHTALFGRYRGMSPQGALPSGDMDP